MKCISNKLGWNRLLTLLSAVVGLSAFAAPRPEHPRPQFERTDWVNLNDQWTYALDPSGSGLERGLMKSQGFTNQITVPFAPESKLSGVEFKDFIEHLWYHRKLSIPADWAGRRVLLNFGAVYYEAEVYVDGKFVLRHFGGTSSFAADLTPFVKPGGEHDLVVYVRSHLRDQMQPGGKQSTRLNSHVCNYTRTTGIWQTVWLEAVSLLGLRQVQVITDIDQGQFVIHPRFYSLGGGKFRVTVKDGASVAGQVTAPASESAPVVIPIKDAKLWSPANPFLYDVTYEVLNARGEVVDTVRSYVGLRKIHTAGNRLFLNNQPLYLRLVLDQGYYPESQWTAPSDAALKRDIELAMSCGFNGARLHQKVFEERFHYWADKLGYLTWGESSSWGLDYNRPEAARIFTPEWIEILERDRNHPSIIAWVPNNEQNNIDRVNFPRYLEELYRVTKLLDPTRPFVGNSGGTHFAADIYTAHNYEQNPAALKKAVWNDGKLMRAHQFDIEPRLQRNTGSNFPEYNAAFRPLEYDGTMPYLLDEFGGIAFSGSRQATGWGYGGTKSQNDFYQRVGAMVDGLLELAPAVSGYCYTQLTDVEQEQNGLFFYDREPKFDPARLRAIFGKQPAKP
jgi:beta-galactosidase/beta-glucuronidase